MIEIPKDNPKGDYQPIPSNLGSFMSSVASTEAVEEAPLNPPPAADPEPDFEDLGGMNGGEGGMNWPPADEEDHPGQKKVSRFTGEMMARFTDRLFANVASMYTHGKIEDYEASQKEMEELVECYRNWASEEGVQMSPTATLLMSLGGLYVFRLPSLYRDRKHNLELEARQEAAKKAAERAKNGGAVDVTATGSEAGTNTPTK